MQSHLQPQVFPADTQDSVSSSQTSSGSHSRSSSPLIGPLVVDCVSLVSVESSAVPLAFVSSQNDRVVPTRYQRLIFDAYAGPKKLLTLDGADHGQQLEPQHEQPYIELIKWLSRSACPAPVKP